MSIFRTLAFAAALAVCAACSSNAPRAQKGDAASTREQTAVDALHLKSRYKDIVSGTEVQGNNLIVYVDKNALLSMDTPAEDAMIAQTLAQWRLIWRKAHPGKHARLRVSVRDYYGNEITGNSANA